MTEAAQMPLIGDVDPSVRRAFDYYPTPAWMTEALIRRVRPFAVIEPCSGEDAIADVFRKYGVDVQTNDLDPSRPAQTHGDATLEDVWARFMAPAVGGTPSWAVTNPPFEYADQIVPLAVQHCAHVAMMLRLSWLEPTKARSDFLRYHPPDLLIVMPRHDFKGRGSTDSVTSAWFVWTRSVMRGINVVTKAERDKLIAECR